MTEESEFKSSFNDKSPEKHETEEIKEEKLKSPTKLENSDKKSNPYLCAFNDLEFQEINEEEIKASQEIADKYMKEQADEEREWFLKAEEDLLRQLINDCQLEEFIGGELDEETIKAIYRG